MTPQEKLEKIREACIRANPSILDLGFGCNTSYGTFIGTISVKQKKVHRFIRDGDYHGHDVSHALSKERGFEIIGRTIRLADVLYMLKDNTELYVSPDGIFCRKHPTYHWVSSWSFVPVYKWNLLKDDITLQKPEVWDFVYSLIQSNQ